MNSLRGRITMAYSLVAAAVVALGILQIGVLGVIERRISANEAVADLLQDTLEMRRNEKKYFLLGDDTDLQAALAGAEAALARLHDRRAEFARLTSAQALAELEASLRTYRSLLALYDTASGGERNDISERARAAGHEASQGAKVLSGLEREDVIRTVDHSVLVLVGFYVPVVLLVIAGGRALSARVLSPLRDLEAGLKPIAEGRYRHLALPTLDREIVSFGRAFNGMLAELNTRQEQLRHSERLASLGTLVSGVAHELNNPLGNISASTQLLLEAADRRSPEQCRNWLKRIDDETERARAIVRTLLDYARRTPERPSCDDCVALEEILVDARAAAAAGAPRRVILELPVEIVLMADEERLRRTFINLIQNGLDAGGANSQIRVTARLGTWSATPPNPAAWTVGGDALGAEPDQPVACVCFDDDGPGIPKEILPRIFDPFFTTREAGQGTGLGLYIVQEIVQEHGGAVAAENRRSGGARFTVWLPVRCDSDRAAPAPPAAAPGGGRKRMR